MSVDIRAKKKVSSEARLDVFSSGQKISSIDSTTLQQYSNQSIANLISQQLPVFVKSYSFNGLATVSFRGASAAQSQVMWNGVPIRNAALGVADISTLPVLFANKVNVVYGSSGALYGSGNIGGALLIESEKAIFDTGHRSLSGSFGTGSFNQFSGSIKGAISRKKWYLSANAFTQTAQNNYPYKTSSGSEQKMQNGRLQSVSGMMKTAYKLDNNNVVDINLWYQQYARQIPPALFEPYSVKHQEDNSFRTVAKWTHNATRHNLYAKASFISDLIKYEDSSVQLSTSNQVHQYYIETGWKQILGNNTQLLVFTPVQLSALPNGVDSQKQTRFALATALNRKFANKKVDLSVQARAELINNTKIFLPGFGLSYRIAEWLGLRGNIQRTYRAPSLNELYYFPGGNTNLKPENGWSGDMGYRATAHSGKLSFIHDLSAFSRNINDWIVWLGGAVWTPHNLAKVHSRGVETENRIAYKTGNWRINLSVNTSYILSTTTASYVIDDASIGKQIPYAPRYNGRLILGVNFKQLYVSYNHSYTGYRFITTDESAYLEPYQTGNILAAYTFDINKIKLQLNAQYNNIYGANYSVAGFRPMPLSNWITGIRITL